MPPVFRQSSPPPIHFFEQWVKNVGLQSISDRSPFTKQQIQMDAMEQLLIELLPYYLPCRTKEYLESPLTQIQVLTIGRQLARLYGVHISSQEKTILGKKYLTYTLTPNSQPVLPSDGITIDFT